MPSTTDTPAPLVAGQYPGFQTSEACDNPMVEPAKPLPWQVRYGDTVADATGAKVAGCWRPENAAFIVHCVNGFVRMKQEAAEADAEILVPSDAFDEFKSAVRSMREWQRAYFRARSGETLNRAKAAEREVDAMLARFDRRNEPKQEQLPLEGGAS